jgi:hypothetical protein
MEAHQLSTECWPSVVGNRAIITLPVQLLPARHLDQQAISHWHHSF